LVIHGAGGGFDQGLMAANDWIGDSYRFITSQVELLLSASIPDSSIYMLLMNTKIAEFALAKHTIVAKDEWKFLEKQFRSLI